MNGRIHRHFQAAAIAAALSMVGSCIGVFIAAPAHATPAAVGQGFTVTPSDLAFILEQIKIAERHSAAILQEPNKVNPPPNPDLVGDPEYCSVLVGPGPDQVPDSLTSYGLRTVDGACNNLVPGNQRVAQADQPFPRLTSPAFRSAEPITPSFPVGPPGPTSYAQKRGVVIDSQPRVISNLIVDQTSTNPAAVAAAGFPVRTQNDPGLFPCDTVPGSDPPVDIQPPQPVGCVPSHQTLFIPNVTTNVGLSPPYNSLFTFFGQFFDHGLDQTLKSGGTVFVPLQADDPLIAGPDHIAGTADDLPPQLRFMVLTRAQNQPGPDGVHGDDPTTPRDESADDTQDTNNSDSPWIDQSQTYSSHASHQVFLRQYVNNKRGNPVSSGKLLGGIVGDDPLPCQTVVCYNDGAATTGSLSTWAATKKQAAELLGLKLTDRDVTNVPMIATDPYGQFIPGPLRKLPQYVTAHGLVEGCRVSDVCPDLPSNGPVPVPANVVYFDTPFLTDIAHNADPSPQDTDNNPATPPVAPVPDADSVASADFANQTTGTYDDEMLNDHFTCGDGRCNENIALSAIHQVFHSEHDRLVDDIKNVLTSDTSASGVQALTIEWQSGSGAPDGNGGGWNGERLFQAARFITEMEYQHMVFEEFARKIQPAIKLFEGYSSDINPAIPAEFASAVYRFGHSMLDETVARTNVDPATGARSDNSLPLLSAFLNPPAYFNGGAAGTLSPQRAAGALVMGSSDQVGNELDEFVTETLRNNLLGLPLDLATLNLTRARDVGIPPLNDVRRQIFARTNEGQLAPYTSWSDFGQHLKHPESLINFVAAYGTHPSITGATTLAAKRAAARAIVKPLPTDVAPADAAAFMFGTGPWAGAGGVTTTGLDSVDLWIGGLAEVTNVNGGLLGTTFNYVFQTTLENLQDGDRFYYLARAAGMNLLSQLEGNSFAEIIERNTDGTHLLKADAFATADCKFQLANLHGTAADFATLGATVADDPTTTDCNETLLLQRKPDGTIQYKAVNSVDPVGINGQSVYDGTPGVDRVAGGNDNDTFWGGLGNDVIEGGGGDDVALGGDGDDIVTDSNGLDTEKGGPGNDALDGGPGNDLLLGGDGRDFVNGGVGDNTEFGGPGADFIIGGTGADVSFGDGGDDWIEGGLGVDLLQGDHGAPFFDDPGQVSPGNDVFVGQAGDNNYQAEGGDDLMAQNAAIDRNVGAGGFDWAFHQYDTVPANDDMNINNNLGGPAQPVIVNRDTWQETEADSGYDFNDVIKGTDVVHSGVGGKGFSGCDVLDQAGVNRITGLNAIVPQPLTGNPAPVIAHAATKFCPISGPVWGAGDILVGGRGSDSIEGRGGGDIIDGDRFVQVRISVRTDPANPATEIGSTDLMEDPPLTGNFGPGTAGMTLQQAVFTGLVDPDDLVTVREMVAPTVTPADCGSAQPSNCDTAVFSGPQSDYVVAVDADGTVRVRSTGSSAGDGTDTLRNIEQLSFCSGTLVAGVCNIARTVVAPSGTPGPTLSSISPPAAQLGATILLNGANFSPAATVVVSFTTAGGPLAATPATVVVPTQIRVTVPSTAVSGPVQVTTAVGSASLAFVVIPAFVAPAVPPVVSPVVPPPSPASPTFTTVEPFRAFDTRAGEPGMVPVARTRVGGASVLDVKLTGIAGVIPASGVGALSLNVTVADADEPGFVTVYPCGQRPTASNVNFVAGQIVANAVIAPVSADGHVCFFANVATNLIVDVNGWYAAGAGFHSVVPNRLFDTRPGEMGTLHLQASKVGGSRVLDVSLADLNGVVPTIGVAALSLNVTAEGADGPGFVTVYPCGDQPMVSNLNFVAGQIVANAVIAPVSAGGHVCFFANVATNLIVDVNGWYATGSEFHRVTPGRAFDTRPGETGILDVPKAKVGGGYVLDVAFTNLAGMTPPAGVAAVSLNVTVDGAQGPGFLTVYPCGQPSSSSVNFVAAQIVANAVISPVSATGHVCFFSNVPTDVIVDVNGWFSTT